MSTQMQNNDFLLDTINEAIDAGADAIATQYALQRLNETGSVNIQECATIYLMAKEVLTEGNEDLIPDNIELPEDDGELDEEGEDLDVSDLEGIVLPTADGGLMVIENGVLVPYSEEEAATPAGEAPEAELNESETNSEGSETEAGEEAHEGSELNENTNTDVDSGVQTIEESADLSKHSSVVQSLISQMNFSKGGF
jgi:hypothetical protein